MCEKLGDKNSTETIRTGNILLYASNNNIRLVAVVQKRLRFIIFYYNIIIVINYNLYYNFNRTGSNIIIVRIFRGIGGIPR